jgi:hypothetical protein
MEHNLKKINICMKESNKIDNKKKTKGNLYDIRMRIQKDTPKHLQSIPEMHQHSIKKKRRV